MPNSDPCQIITPLVLLGLGLGVGEGFGLRVGLGLGNQIAISMRGVIVWQGVENGHNNGLQIFPSLLKKIVNDGEFSVNVTSVWYSTAFAMQSTWVQVS